MSNLKQKRFVDTDYLQENVVERLEILENVTEGQNMEYSTDQGFIHCTNTKKGRVNDLAIEGNTMVNYCRDGSKTLTLNGDINEVGTRITTTNAVNNGLVDVMCEGETLVNVCNQKDPVAITKAYTVENTNHIPLQGEYDGKARPIVEGNTLVNIHPKSTPSFSVSDSENTGYNIVKREGYIKVTGSDLGTTAYRYVNMGQIKFDMFKPNTVYTLVFTKLKGAGQMVLQDGNSQKPISNSIIIQDNVLAYTFRTKETYVKSSQILYLWTNSNLTTIDIEVENPMIFEGDLTANPPSGYIEGLKSSFEDQLVTSSSDPNYGKYKVEYKVTGKNKLKLDDLTRTMDNETFTLNVKNNVVTATSTKSNTSVEHICISPITIYLEKGKTYTMSFKSDVGEGINPGTDTVEMYLLLNGTYDLYYRIGFKTTFTPSTSGKYNLRFDLNRAGTSHTFYDIQIEEGSSKTTYEAYKEYTKTFYLNSPLLEGDTIEDVNGKATHVKRYAKTILDGSENWIGQTSIEGFYRCATTKLIPTTSKEDMNGICDRFRTTDSVSAGSKNFECMMSTGDGGYHFVISSSKLSTQDEEGFKQWLQSNPTTVVYKLATPIYEKISEESILTDSYVNGHLDLDTNVTVNKVDFRNASGLSLNYIQPNTNYVLQFEADNNGQLDISWLGAANIPSTPIQKGINKITVTTGEKTNTWLTLIGIGFNASNISVVATEREFDYFGGLYSVGQDDENNHSIEILSQNKNLYKPFLHVNSAVGLTFSLENGKTIVNGTTTGLFDYRPIYDDARSQYKFVNNLPIGTSLTLSNNLGLTNYWAYRKNGEMSYIRDSITITEGMSEIGCFVRFESGQTYTNQELQIQVELNSMKTPYTPYTENKKSITLNEPLRGLPNGVKDRIVKMNNKWYVERNCGEIEVVSTMSISLWGGVPNTINNSFSIQTGIKNKNTDTNNIVLNCDKHIPRTRHYLPNTDAEGVCDSQTQGNILIKLSATKLTEYSVEAFKAWLTNNPFKITYQLDTPIYEELTVDPTLTTYVDKTHISNNSVIPCNMTVKNSGYSTIIKPSTLYTIALDTNKSREVKVNLGGAEKTATNNIVTLTTPSTLVDDSLRISGKGLTSTNVRLLEGDNTNYIPNYFEGLKSSFEDTKQGDNHIVEVVSENGDKSNKIQFSTLAPLRSVGDIKDKLVYKDNKWMIERNCMQIDLTSSLPWSLNATIVSKNSTQFVSKILKGYLYDSTPREEQILCNKKPTKNINAGNNSIWVYDKSTIVMQMDYRFIKTTSEFREWLDTEKPYIVIPLTNPTYEEIGEYKNLDSYDEGTTIYANTLIAPKSLSFSLASHMSNIVKDVQDDVSDLKTWRSEVFDSITHKKTFDNGFTTIEETKNGVIDDLKIEGKTLVNLCPKYVKNSDLWVNKTFESDSDGFVTVHANGTWLACPRLKMSSTNVKPNTVYTLILDVKLNTLNSSNGNGFEFVSSAWSGFAFKVNIHVAPNKTGRFIHKITSVNDFENVYELFRSQLYNTCTSGTIVYRWYLLEGDHTQNSPSYFEGLMSVGQDVDKIEVLSSKGFDLDGELEQGGLSASGLNTPNSIRLRSKNYSRVLENKKYKISTDDGYYLAVSFYTTDDFTTPRIGVIGWSDSNELEFTTPKGTRFIRINIKYKTDTTLYASSTKVTTEYKGNKKQILFYNENGELEPIQELHEWDSIEKHSDNKWYYHKRSEKVVLNGSENWEKENSDLENTILFGITFSNIHPIENTSILANLICDSFYTEVSNSQQGTWGVDKEAISVNPSKRLHIRISKSKLSSLDVQGFKQWLQANNVTVVYQLAQEEVYECINLDLNSYEGETSVILNSGAISPITMVSLTSNLPQVAENLKNRVRQLEAELYNYKVNQNLRQLRTFYKSDYANFGVATLNNYSIEPTSIAITPYGYDLFEIFKEVIAQGKDKYDRIELEEYIDFYLMTFVFDFDMVFELFDLLDANEDIIEDEPVEEEPPMEEEEEIVEDTPTILPLLPEDEEVVEDTPTILPILPEDEATPIPLI